MAKFDIWTEGFLIQGMDEPAKASLVAKDVEADSFKEAVRKHYSKDGKINSLIDLERLTYWGCRLYPTEKEARRSFG